MWTDIVVACAAGKAHEAVGLNHVDGLAAEACVALDFHARRRRFPTQAVVVETLACRDVGARRGIRRPPRCCRQAERGQAGGSCWQGTAKRWRTRCSA